MIEQEIADLDVFEAFIRRLSKDEQEAEAILRVFKVEQTREYLAALAEYHEQEPEEEGPGTHDNPVPEDYDEAYESALASYAFYCAMLDEEDPPLEEAEIWSAIAQAEETINTLRRLKKNA